MSETPVTDEKGAVRGTGERSLKSCQKDQCQVRKERSGRLVRDEQEAFERSER